MGVDHPEGAGLELQIFDQPGQDDVLHHIGEAAGMEGVAVVHACRAWAERITAAKVANTPAKPQLRTRSTIFERVRAAVSHSALSTMATPMGSDTSDEFDAEKEQLARRVGVAHVHELRQEGHEEQHDLGVQQIDPDARQEALRSASGASAPRRPP